MKVQMTLMESGLGQVKEFLSIVDLVGCLILLLICIGVVLILLLLILLVVSGLLLLQLVLLILMEQILLIMILHMAYYRRMLLHYLQMVMIISGLERILECLFLMVQIHILQSIQICILCHHLMILSILQWILQWMHMEEYGLVFMLAIWQKEVLLIGMVLNGKISMFQMDQQGQM